MPRVSTPSASRPYRSHLQPACSTCKKRKIRCQVDAVDQACRFCAERGLDCIYSAGENDSTPLVASSSSTQRPAKRIGQTHRSPQSRRQRSEARDPETSTTGPSPTDGYLLVQPGLAEDVAILQRYLSGQPDVENNTFVKEYSLVSSQHGPVVYLSIPRLRKGLAATTPAGQTQLEIVRQILGASEPEVIKVFFQWHHPCFPIVDERSFAQLWQSNEPDISPALMCDILANGLVFWERSETLRRLQKPDTTFIWNQAVAALKEDFMAPTFSTLHAALLDLVGRPILGMQGNILLCARTVSFAHTIGLHRDPTEWQIPEHEKHARVRLWWAVRTHDAWSSIAHGTPPSIRDDTCDTPLPTVQSLESIIQHPAAESFHYLCALTQILSGILPYVHLVHATGEQMLRASNRSACLLDAWQEDLPMHLRPEGLYQINGSSNLWFCSLSIRLLLHRLSLRAALKQGSEAVVIDYWLLMVRTAACDIATMASELTEAQCSQFWLPYTAYLLVSSATMLLRCTIEVKDRAVKEMCASKLRALVTHLKHTRIAWQWDIADSLLGRCQSAIDKVSTKVLGPDQPAVADSDLDRGATNTFAAQADFDVTGTDAFLLPIDSLDMPWENLWGKLETPWL